MLLEKMAALVHLVQSEFVVKLELWDLLVQKATVETLVSLESKAVQVYQDKEELQEKMVKLVLLVLLAHQDLLVKEVNKDLLALLDFRVYQVRLGLLEKQESQEMKEYLEIQELQGHLVQGENVVILGKEENLGLQVYLVKRVWLEVMDLMDKREVRVHQAPLVMQDLLVFRVCLEKEALLEHQVQKVTEEE